MCMCLVACLTRVCMCLCVGIYVCGWVQVKSERGHHLIKIEDVLFDLRYLLIYI